MAWVRNPSSILGYPLKPRLSHQTSALQYDAEQSFTTFTGPDEIRLLIFDVLTQSSANPFHLADDQSVFDSLLRLVLD